MNNRDSGIHRRDVLGAGIATAVGLHAAPGSAATPHVQGAEVSPLAARPTTITLALNVNGHSQHVTLDPRTTLLDALRETLALTGTKKGCDHGQCGACTVLIDGRRVLGCLTLAVMVHGRAVTTIEGLSPAGGELHPMQQAFIDHDGFQCGYCTPGQIMSAIGCVQEGHAENDADIREYMSGNLCRCAAYPNIVAAIRDAKPKMQRV